MRLFRFLILCCLCSFGMEAIASSSNEEEIPKTSNESKTRLLSGFSIGLTAHVGYAFSSSPEELFRNISISDLPQIANLPKDGVTMGVGAMIRLHLLNHLHLGVEGNFSNMPLMRNGSSLRNGWGGVLVNYYTEWGKVRPMIGASIGGGDVKRIYVPAENVNAFVPGDSTTIYNSSHTSTPYFYIDPYIGIEFVPKRLGLGLMIKVDYMLPFGSKSTGTLGENIKESVTWSNLMTPTGPRLYVGLILGK